MEIERERTSHVNIRGKVGCSVCQDNGKWKTEC